MESDPARSRAVRARRIVVSFDRQAYVALEQLAGRMADLAEAGQFESLAELEDAYTRCTADLQARAAESPEEIEHAAPLIRRIAEHHRRIAGHAGPHLDELRRLLRATRHESAVSATYR